jgi:hypothetical protein
MRPRWQEWVLFSALIVIGFGGIAAIWGDDLVALWSDVAKEGERPREGLEPAAPVAQPPSLPAGPPPTPI